ncbi:hypothetical protein MWH03_00320 [Klebsiella pneumoniae]|nr:hypothetical protein [Klebsiella pneumoniae]
MMRRAGTQSTWMYDAKALELSARVMELFEGPMPLGGAVQLQAMIQNLFIDAMRFANPGRTPGTDTTSQESGR